MPNYNKVTLIGHLGKDPVVKTFNDGNKIAAFTMATTEKWKDKNTGEVKSETQWHNIVIKNQQIAQICEKYLKKGNAVFVEGKLTYRKYQDNNGVEKPLTEVVLSAYDGKLQVLSSKEENTTSTKPQNKVSADQSYFLNDDVPF